MSCQQASRFHSATAAATLARSPASRNKSLATTITAVTAATAGPVALKATSLGATAAAAATASASASAATATARLTLSESIAGKTTSEDADPYAFTEAVAVAPPILFNAQKSRARLSDSSRSSNSNSNSNKRQTAAASAASSRKAASLVAQQNGTTAAAAAAAAATATAKAQASLATTTNFHHVTQSHRPAALSPVQLQLLLPLQTPSQLQSQSQASPKRATNVCIVRPQQQQQQQQQLEKPKPADVQQAGASPPPLYSHTPSLWQTPLLLDSSQKQQSPKQQSPHHQLLIQHPQQQQQQQQQILYQQQQQQLHLVTQQAGQQTIAIALVSPPTSPASLPSPTLPPANGTVTAMVAPISVSPKSGGLPLPPSKFHHTTLAQHLQKVECLKKKKSLPLVCQSNNNISNNNNNSKLQNNNIVGESALGKLAPNYNHTQPPPLTVFQAAGQSPIAVAPHKHSVGQNVEESDLNDIPVNVIFRKPTVAGAAGASEAGGLGVKLVTPLTPPTPPEMTTSPLMLATAPALQISTASIPATPPPAPTPANAMATTTAPAPPGPAPAKKTEQMSSKVANKRGNTTSNNHNNNRNTVAAAAAKKAIPPAQEPVLKSSSPSPSLSPAPEEPENRPRCRKSASVRCSPTLSENPTLAYDSPYCLQMHWMDPSSGVKESPDSPSSPSNRREERIARKKGLLRRQALQLLSTRSLQEFPLRSARQRLKCVQNLLLKYQDHAAQQPGIGIGNRCLVANCKEPTLSMAAHCARHIVNNGTQQLFQACVAWRVDGTACKAPVFDVLHTLALCKEHSHLRTGLDAARPAPKVTTVPVVAAGAGVVASGAMAVKQRKRRANPSPGPRPQKRGRKPQAEKFMPLIQQSPMVVTGLPPISSSSSGMQRKSSTTSLESIASNSHSSHSSMAPVTMMPQTLPQISIPPALAPLSAEFQAKQLPFPDQPLLPKLEAVEALLLQSAETGAGAGSEALAMLATANIKAEEINQIVAQLAAASGDLPQHNNNNSMHFNNNNNIMSFSNNNHNSGSHSQNGPQQASFPSFNTAFGSALGQPSITQNGLVNTPDLDMFGICENSSAYASSEDTGLGGLSESELMGANDAGESPKYIYMQRSIDPKGKLNGISRPADDIALNGAQLLEEHDLVNVFDTLPDDAFNELFESVQQAECEAMDRALEIADKNLKCLQQTIGGSDSSAFLNDFLDVSDDLLADAVMHSPNTSGIDASTLFVDSSSGGGNSSSASDISRLVQA
ncbi:hypothetical protein KR018_005726 [Drosophila ironensis]|nr:hypothetical protein KR018_005726 [Drosophila ironensis]